MQECADYVKIYAPQQAKDIVTQVREAMLSVRGGAPYNFEPYLAAVQVLWPQLARDPQALLRLSIDVYLEIAELEGFMVMPESFIRHMAA